MSTTPRHFALFVGGFPGGSQTNVSVYLVSGLALQGHTVDLVTLNTEKADLVAYYSSVEGIEQVQVYSLGVSNAWRSILPLVAYYKAHRPDVLFSQLTYFNAIAVVARILSGAKTANILLEGTLLSKMIASDSKFSAKLMLVPALAKLTYPLAQGFIGKSQDIVLDTQDVVGKGLERVKTTVLPNPYPFERFKALALEEPHHPWFQPGELPVVISSGRLCEQKGFDTLIQAFAEVQQQCPCRLMILGEGPDRPALEALIRKLNLETVVEMPGRVSNPWQYVARSTVFVLASRWEGFPSALMEAMALGIPAISTDCPGDAKKMIDHGRSGLIVSTDHVAMLRDAVLSLLRDASCRAAFSQASQAYANQYDYRAIAQKYSDFADSVVEKSRVHPLQTKRAASN